jgi:hypothetical protein
LEASIMASKMPLSCSRSGSDFATPVKESSRISSFSRTRDCCCLKSRVCVSRRWLAWWSWVLSLLISTPYPN